jgi:hypothetical protein
MLKATVPTAIVSRPAPSDAPYEFERGVVAKSFASAGALVCVAEPYAAVLLDDVLRTHCSETFQRLGRDAVRDAACGSFIDRAARARAVARGFDAFRARCERRLPTTSARLALACLARRELERKGKIERERYDGTFDDDARGYDALLALHEGPSTREMTGGADSVALRKRRDASASSMVVAALMCDAMRPGIEPDEIQEKLAALKEEQDVDPQSALRLLSIFEANAFSIATEDAQRLGLGIYPSASLFNHSSTPNCDVVFVGKTLVVKALRDINAGEELTISYGEQYMPREWTRRRMMDGYGFDEYSKYANVARADAARDRAHAAAIRSTLAFDHGTLVDLGEDCALYADDSVFLADEDLARDAFWYELSHPKLNTKSGEAGMMLVPGDALDENYHPNDDQIIIWGRFPEGVDRELTALNFSKACRIVETVRRKVERDRFSDVRENVSMLSRATTMLAGDGDTIAGVCATHEVRKYLHLTQVVLSISMRGQDMSVNYVADTVCLASSNVLQRVYELCPGFSKLDAVYVHLRFQIFKVTLNLLGFELHNNDAKNAVKRIKDAIVAYNELKQLMAIGGVPGGQIYEEWAEHSSNYAEDLANLRVMAKNMIAAGAHKKP